MNKNVHTIKCRKSLMEWGFCDTLYKIKGNRKGDISMARLYKTPNILKKQSRKSAYADKNGNITDNWNDERGKVDSVETRLLNVLNAMLEEKQDLNLSHLLHDAKVRGASKYRYEEIYSDTLEMLKKYLLHQMNKDNDEQNIPDFIDLEKAVKDKVNASIQSDGIEDTFGALVFDMKGMISDELSQSTEYMIDAYTAFLSNGIHIHPAFVGYSLNELFGLIEDKYNKIKALKEEYKNL